MKLSPDSPELTAYVLGELPPGQRAAVEAALAESPELAAEVRQLSLAAEMVREHLAAEPAVRLGTGQRLAVLRPPEAVPEARMSLIAKLAGFFVRSSSARSPGFSRQRVSQPDERKNLQRMPDAAAQPPEGGTPNREAPHRRRVRAPWIWGTATAALAALALTLTLWPQRRAIEEDFATLRYQHQRTAGAPAGAVKSEEPLSRSQAPVEAPQSPAVTPPAPATANLVEERLSLAKTPPPQSVPQLQTLLESRSSNKASTGTAYFYRMDPDLGRRYGLGLGLLPQADGLSAANAPTQGEEPASGPVTWTPELKDASRLSDQAVSLNEAELPALRGRLMLGREFQMFRGIGGDALAESPGTESYAPIADNPFKSPTIAPLSTFGLDVDTASYANVRRFLREGSLPPPDAVRLEELINYFRYDYPPARGDHPLAAAVEIAECPWKEGHKLVRVAVQARSVDRAERPRANLVFLLDVSGSMEPENKLPLVKRSLRLLLDRLTERDSVGIVTYAGESRVALEPTAASESGRRRIAEILETLRAGSGTAGSAGIQAAYALATNQFIPGGVNRVLLCTDGDFNIGITDPAELHRLIEERAKSGVFLSVLGYGMGNTKDSTMELLADRGNGNYAYVDSFAEARKVLGEQLEGTLVTVAKDVKVQVEFNPARVRSYRLLGYENRALRDRDFNDDTKDAGEVGAGHQVTVLYEIEPAVPNLAGTDPLRYQGQGAETSDTPPTNLKRGHEDELLLLKIRYKTPEGSQSRLMEQPVKEVIRDFDQASADFRFSAAVAGYGMLLRQSPHRGDLTWDRVLRIAEQGLGKDREGYRAEFVDLARKAQTLSGGQ